jgi:hypothetical protein
MQMSVEDVGELEIVGFKIIQHLMRLSARIKYNRLPAVVHQVTVGGNEAQHELGKLHNIFHDAPPGKKTFGKNFSRPVLPCISQT